MLTATGLMVLCFILSRLALIRLDHKCRRPQPAIVVNLTTAKMDSKEQRKGPLLVLQCQPRGHYFTVQLSFGESSTHQYCPECDQEVPTRKA